MLTARRRDGHAGRKRARGDWTSIPIHPFLVAAYPIVFLFAANADEQVTLDPLWTPLALALGATAVILVALALLLHDWLRAALLTTVALIGFFGYGHAWNAASKVADQPMAADHRVGAAGLDRLRGRLARRPNQGPGHTRPEPRRRARSHPQRRRDGRDDGRAEGRSVRPAGSARSSWRRRIRTTCRTSTTSSLTDTRGRPRSRRRTIRQRAVPHRARGARVRRAAPRPRELHQDAALSG